MNLPKRQASKLIKRIKENTFRTLYPQNELIDFSSNDYLGFSKNMHISKKVQDHLNSTEQRNGSTGSRLLTGNMHIHEEVELELAKFFNAPSALLFTAGYDANIGLLSSVPQHGDTILFDELCHASIRDGIRLSHAKSFSFKHNDLESLKKKFSNLNSSNAIFIVVESVYSMDGDSAPIIDLVEFCNSNNCYLIIDEAHATGVFGNHGAGLVDELGVSDQVFARVHTFGKALGCHGAVVVGSKELRDFLINYARSFVYTTAMPAHSALTIKYAIAELQNTPEIDKLKGIIKHFKNEIVKNQLNDFFILSDSAIQSCIVGNVGEVKKISTVFTSYHFDIKAILSPTVPIGTERLRICLHSYNSMAEINRIIDLFSNFTANLKVAK